jgi:hypothetical protein
VCSFISGLCKTRDSAICKRALLCAKRLHAAVSTRQSIGTFVCIEACGPLEEKTRSYYVVAAVRQRPKTAVLLSMSPVADRPNSFRVRHTSSGQLHFRTHFEVSRLALSVIAEHVSLAKIEVATFAFDGLFCSVTLVDGPGEIVDLTARVKRQRKRPFDASDPFESALHQASKGKARRIRGKQPNTQDPSDCIVMTGRLQQVAVTTNKLVVPKLGGV